MDNSQSIQFAKNYRNLGGFKVSLTNRYYLDWNPDRKYGADLNWNLNTKIMR